MFAVTWDVKIYALKAYFEWDNYVVTGAFKWNFFCNGGQKCWDLFPCNISKIGDLTPPTQTKLTFEQSAYLGRNIAGAVEDEGMNPKPFKKLSLGAQW